MPEITFNCSSVGSNSYCEYRNCVVIISVDIYFEKFQQQFISEWHHKIRKMQKSSHRQLWSFIKKTQKICRKYCSWVSRKYKSFYRFLPSILMKCLDLDADGIHNKVLKNLPERALVQLRDIFTAAIRNQYFTTVWKKPAQKTVQNCELSRQLSSYIAHSYYGQDTQKTTS